jgi:hypothetical protein
VSEDEDNQRRLLGGVLQSNAGPQVGTVEVSTPHAFLVVGESEIDSGRPDSTMRRNGNVRR